MGPQIPPALSDGNAQGDPKHLLIAAVTLATGKPYAQAQYLLDQAWPKMEALKPNVLSIFQNEEAITQVIQGQADVAGLFYSKSVNPYNAKGAPVAMCYPREGTFRGINTATLVKNAPDRELGIAFINWRLQKPRNFNGFVIRWLGSTLGGGDAGAGRIF